METKKKIFAFTIGGGWHLSIETNDKGIYYGTDLHYSIRTKKQVKEYCKENYPNHELEF